jgi:paraquat-inducible protein B
MSKKISKTLIGAFVTGAIGLLVVAILVFGSGKFFAPTKKFVMFFSGSVKGLNVGSAVMFHGVKIGEVTEIQLLFNPKDMSAVIPVYIEIDPRRFVVPKEFQEEIHEKSKKYRYIKPLIEKGFKGQLQMQSFVTGQLMINLDFYPQEPIKLLDLETKYPQIPTIPTTMEALSKTLEELPLKEIVMKLDNTMDGLQKILNAPGAQNVLPSVDAALKEVEKTLATFQNIERNSEAMGYDLSVTLKEVNATSRSLRSFVDYLNRHPEALIRGKQ